MHTTLPSWTSLLPATPSILDWHRAPVWAPWVIWQVPTGCPFYIWQSTYFLATLHSSHPLLSSPCVHKSVFLLSKHVEIQSLSALLPLVYLHLSRFTQPTFICSQPLTLHLFYNREALSLTLLGRTLQRALVLFGRPIFSGPFHYQYSFFLSSRFPSALLCSLLLSCPLSPLPVFSSHLSSSFLLSLCVT